MFIAGITPQLVAGEESLLPPGKTWRLIWSDEFDGEELDASKWNFRLHSWGKIQPAFTDRAVELDGQGHLRIHLLKRANGSLCSSQLQTCGFVCDIPTEKRVALDPGSSGIGMRADGRGLQPEGDPHWSPAGYVFYIGGQEVNRVETPVSETEQFLLISGEPYGYRPVKENLTPLGEDEAVTSVVDFEVNYVRVFDSSASENVRK